MKKLIIVSAIVLTFLYTEKIFPQEWAPSQAIASLLEGIEDASTKVKSKFGFDNVLGTYLVQGKKSVIITQLERDKDYIFIAGGDKKAMDVDIIVNNDSYKVLKRDIERRQYAIVSFTPKYTGTYYIEVSMGSTETDAPAFAVLTTMEEKLYSNVEDVKDALKSLERAWTDMPEKYKKTYKPEFATDPELVDNSYVGNYYSFCLFGRYIQPGNSDGYTGNGMTAHEDYVMFSAGDNNANELKLTVTSKEGSSTDKYTTPYVAFNSGNEKLYDFTVENVNAKLKTFVMTCMVKLK
jgi:hypothetical protein